MLIVGMYVKYFEDDLLFEGPLNVSVVGLFEGLLIEVDEPHAEVIGAVEVQF